MNGPSLWGLFDPKIRDNPYPHYRRLRQSARAHRETTGTVLLTRHADCLALLRDQRFGHRKTPSRYPRSFLFLDPPEHTRLRNLVGKAFTPSVVSRLRPRIERLVAQMLGGALATGEGDLIPGLAYPLPVTVICELLGIPPGDRALLRQWSHDLALAFDPDFDFAQPPHVLARRDQARQAFGEYFLELADSRRRRPQSDLISRLVAVEDHAEVLSPEELVATCELLLLAGHETTLNLLGNGTLALLRHPDQLDLLRREPELAVGAVEELLRYDSPVQFVARTALADGELAGIDIQSGDLVIALIAEANRDPEVFHEPDRLDITRSTSHHLAFGFGIHACLGAPLARIEGRIALTALARLPGLTLAGPIAYRDNPVLRGPATLPVRLGVPPEVSR